MRWKGAGNARGFPIVRFILPFISCILQHCTSFFVDNASDFKHRNKGTCMRLYFSMLHYSMIVMDESSYIILMRIHRPQKMNNGDSLTTTVGANVNTTPGVTSAPRH